ncbi:helix-turn-helix domain-containing protein [Xanthomonas albilineans]|uniref:helix-turn-helix domain-containing protein n=1 Tax=Xanthomonas albilineans TaxID=29447 RepID=UPI0009B9B633
MWTIEEHVEIKVLARQGMSIREISRQLRVSRNTVRRYLRDSAKQPNASRSWRGRKLDPYRACVSAATSALGTSGLAAGHGVASGDRAVGLPWPHVATAAVHAQPACGPCAGAVGVLRDAGRAADAVRLGRVLARQIHIVRVCGDAGLSRASDVECVTDEKLETLVACHEHAVEFFGGVSWKGSYDKTFLFSRSSPNAMKKTRCC